MSEYKFGIGEHKTVGECKAVVTCDDAPGMWPLIGYVISQSGSCHPHGWAADGRTYVTRTSEFDLMPPAPPKPEPVVRWVNLLRLASGSGSADMHKTEDRAAVTANWAVRNGHTLLRTIRISSEDTDRYAEGWDAALEAAEADLLVWIGNQADERTCCGVVSDLKGKANA